MRNQAYTAQLSALHLAMVQQQPEKMRDLVKPAQAEELTIETRIRVYTDGYVERLKDAVAMDYGATSASLGEEVFAQAVQAYVSATPSKFWDLNQYPIGFAAFLEKSGARPAAIALAKLESAIAEVFWLPDSVALTAEALADFSEEDLGKQAFSLRSAARLLALEYTVNATLTAMRDGADFAEMVQQKEYLLVIRLGNEVERLSLEAEEYQIVSAMQQGATLEAALLPYESQPEFAEKLQRYMARWFSQGIFKR